MWIIITITIIYHPVQHKASTLTQQRTRFFNLPTGEAPSFQLLQHGLRTIIPWPTYFAAMISQSQQKAGSVVYLCQPQKSFLEPFPWTLNEWGAPNYFVFFFILTEQHFAVFIRKLSEKQTNAKSSLENFPKNKLMLKVFHLVKISYEYEIERN